MTSTPEQQTELKAQQAEARAEVDRATREKREFDLTYRQWKHHTVAVLHSHYEVTIEGPDSDGHYCLCVASEDGDTALHLMPAEVALLGAWIND